MNPGEIAKNYSGSHRSQKFLSKQAMDEECPAVKLLLPAQNWFVLLVEQPSLWFLLQSPHGPVELVQCPSLPPFCFIMSALMEKPIGKTFHSLLCDLFRSEIGLDGVSARSDFKWKNYQQFSSNALKKSNDKMRINSSWLEGWNPLIQPPLSAFECMCEWMDVTCSVKSFEWSED